MNGDLALLIAPRYLQEDQRVALVQSIEVEPKVVSHNSWWRTRWRLTSSFAISCRFRDGRWRVQLVERVADAASIITARPQDGDRR